MLSMLASGDYLRIFAVFAKISCGTAVSRMGWDEMSLEPMNLFCLDFLGARSI